jgi:hypothetical protein
LWQQLAEKQSLCNNKKGIAKVGIEYVDSGGWSTRRQQSAKRKGESKRGMQILFVDCVQLLLENELTNFHCIANEGALN